MQNWWNLKNLIQPLLVWLILSESLMGCYMRLSTKDLSSLTSPNNPGGPVSPGPSTPSLSVLQAPLKLEGASLQFTLQLTQALSTDLEFDYRLVDGTAQTGVDFSGGTGHLIIPAGQTEITLTIPTNNRSGFQGNRDFQLILENISNAEVTAHPVVGEIEEANLPSGLIKNQNVNSQDLIKIQAGSKLFYIGYDLDHGEELWVTDGTPTGTQMVKDIFPGNGPSQITRFFALNDVVYFEADDGVHGAEIWRSDGTSSGTYLASDTLPGPLSGKFYPHLSFKGSLYYTTVYNENGGTQIWRITPGTPDLPSPFFAANPIDPLSPSPAQWNQGTMVVMNNVLYFEGHLPPCVYCLTSGLYSSSDGISFSLLKDTTAGISVHNINWMRTCGNKFYFGTYTGFTYSNDQIWVSDGTAAGTVIAKTVNSTGSSGNSPLGCISGDRSLQWANDGVNGSEPWVTNGTSAGTFLLKDINAGISPSQNAYPMVSVNLNGGLVFSAQSSTSGGELWYTDGTAAGTVQLKDFEPGSGSSSWDAQPGQSHRPNNWVIFQNELYFYIRTPSEGFELWKTNGTPAGTTLVKDILTGTASSFPHDLIEFDGKLLFVAREDSHGQELWATDGTTAGTSLYLDLNPGSPSSAFANLTVLNADTLVFTYTDQQSQMARLASYNRLTKATTLLSPDPMPDEGMGFQFLTRFGQELLFAGDDGSWSQQIYKTDLGKTSTGLLVEIAPNGGCNPIVNVGLSNNELYFLAETPEAGKELWVTDGTSSGTMLFKDIVPGTQGLTGASFLTELNGKLLFSISKADTGNELWISDGTSGGTSLLKDIDPGTGNGFGGGFGVDTLATPNLYYFQGRTTATGTELFKTDGTTANTLMLAEQVPGSGSTGIYGQSWINGKLALSMYGTNGVEIYFVSNGAITTKNIFTGAGSSTPLLFTVVGNTLFFVATSAAEGAELWKSDGTVAGTLLVKDIYTGFSGSGINHLYPLGSKVVFTANEPTNGINPWVSDGTSAGTLRLKDFETTSDTWGHLQDAPAATLNNKLYFPRREEAANLGNELYVTDGTASGTVLLKDFEPGANSSIIHDLWTYNNSLYIVVTIPSLSPFIQLWKSDGTTSGTVPLKTFDNITYTNFDPISFLSAGASTLYFVVYNNDRLFQLWQTDGTTAGTKISLPDTTSETKFTGISDPYLFSGDALLFTGTTPLHGAELYLVYP